MLISGVEEPNYLNSSNLKAPNLKKIDCDNEEQESLPKKWLSLDDLKNAAKRENYIHLTEVKNKKNSPKNTTGKTNANTNRKDKWETTQITNNTKNLNAKPQVPKKQDKTHNKVPMNSNKEKEFVTGSKYGILRNRATEEKRGSPEVHFNYNTLLLISMTVGN